MEPNPTPTPKPTPVYEAIFYYSMGVMALIGLGLLAYDLVHSGDPSGSLIWLLVIGGVSTFASLLDAGYLPGDMRDKLRDWKATQK